ncbi:hypothetical protein MKW94_029709 [Papaver nudicaule]|uniref:Histone deacetylase complex subunit SAP30 Sin3 binding domain-containing protein n=1 Tax=Papaver nudicaule TaxID=74823 RepID=A0AA41RT00_PAPNU|nr:hypothetical protein [Papaver nudicaule]
MEGAVYIKKMLGAQVCTTTTRVLSPYRGEEIGTDDELSVLPRHTKVVVTGNNRTKSVLVGLQGVVKKAVGLGGWHWLVLKNGVEVKLQRNALSVLEHPTGLEVDDDDEHGFENSCSSTDTDEKDDEFSRSMMSHKQPSRPRVRLPKPSLSSQKPTSMMDYRDTPQVKVEKHQHSQVKVEKHQPKVNLAKLGTDSLRRYLKYFSIPMNPNPTRDEMVDAVEHHFISLKVDEDEVIKEFNRAAKRLRPNK